MMLLTYMFGNRCECEVHHHVCYDVISICAIIGRLRIVKHRQKLVWKVGCIRLAFMFTIKKFQIKIDLFGMKMCDKIQYWMCINLLLNLTQFHALLAFFDCISLSVYGRMGECVC